MSAKKILGLVLVILLTGMAAFIAFVGVEVGIYDVGPFYSQISQGLDLTGGVSVVYEADNLASDTLDEDLATAVQVMRDRLDSEGYTEATISRQGLGQIRIEIPINASNMVEDPSEITQYLVQPAVVDFMDTAGVRIFGGEDVEQVGVSIHPTDTSRFVVNIKLNTAATEAFAKATTEAVQNGLPLDIQLDGISISKPTVNDSAIVGGEAYIESAEFTTVESASRLANQIRSGALPIEMSESEVRSVSATLGETALSQGVTAGIIGLILVFLFMIGWYRLPGVLSCIALIIYLVLDFALMASIPGVQLTLPGIAGVILAIGMAVDANVIIFERMREEIRSGKTVRTSVKMGFQRAFTAIMDSNITTVIAALVLLYFGTGTIKGFATTLLIGIIISFITAVFVTRGLLHLALSVGLKKTSWYCPAQKEKEQGAETKAIKPRKSFTERLKTMALVPAAILVIALVFAIIGGGLNVGIDFSGGTIMTVELHQVDYDMGVVTGALRTMNIQGAQSTRTGNTTSQQTMAEIRLMNLNDDAAETAQRTGILAEIQKTYPDAEISSVDRVDGVASSGLITNAILSIAIAGVLILGYIWLRFEFLSGCAAIFALLHDVAVMLAFTCILNIPVNSSFIAAVLTIVGYSINNTIVVFDRIRELRKSIGAERNLEDTVNRSISGTITRSINTSITTLLTITAVFVLGVSSVREFSLPIIVGLVAGTFSSVFLAGPLWCKWVLARMSKAKQGNRGLQTKKVQKASK